MIKWKYNLNIVLFIWINAKRCFVCFILDIERTHNEIGWERIECKWVGR